MGDFMNREDMLKKFTEDIYEWQHNMADDREPIEEFAKKQFALVETFCFSKKVKDGLAAAQASGRKIGRPKNSKDRAKRNPLPYFKRWEEKKAKKEQPPKPEQPPAQEIPKQPSQTPV